MPKFDGFLTGFKQFFLLRVKKSLH